MGYLILALLIAGGLFTLWWFKLRKRPAQEPPVPPEPVQRKAVRVTNAASPFYMTIGGPQHQLEWVLEWQPSGNPADGLVQWWAERDPRVPPGSPDFLMVHIDSGGRMTAMQPGERKVYATLAEAPETRVAELLVVVVN
jgi:hypothetical protein